MAKVRIFLLGSPYIETDGEVAAVDTRKAVALLAYLVIHPRRCSRDTLGALLWPENDETGARAALRRTLSVLNKAIDGVGLVAEREFIELTRPPDLWIDIDIFLEAVKTAEDHARSENTLCDECLVSLSQAVQVYRDEFMAGFTLRDSPEFDDWQYLQADMLRRKLGWALERLGDAHSERHEFNTAIDYVQRWLDIDPLNEPTHRALMHLYTWTDQRAQAIRQYRECVRILERELGVAPLEETTQLYEAIKENRLSLPQPSQAALSSAPAATQPGLTLDTRLVGREREMGQLLTAYAAASSRQVVVLEGEAGIGKTRLAEELLHHAHKLGAATLSVHCYASEAHLAYGTIINLLHKAVQTGLDAGWLDKFPDRMLTEVARLLPELHTIYPDLPAAATGEGAAAQAKLFEAVSELLMACLTTQGTGILLVDDIQWADAASQDVLAYMIRRRAERPAVYLFAHRSEESALPNTLVRLAAEGQHEGWASIITPGRLDRTAVADLAASADLPATLAHAAFRQQLYQETEGLPFFVIEYLKHAIEGALQDERHWAMPLSVQDLLRSRIGSVDEVGRQILAAAAVIGRSFDYSILREASGRSEDEIVRALESLLARGLILETPNGEPDDQLHYDFYHPKLREFVYGDTSLARRRLLHRRIAQAVARRSDTARQGGTAFAQTAYHYERAREDHLAAEYYFKAGEQARAVYANRQALEYLRAAQAVGYADAAVLHEAVGDLLALEGDYLQAIQSYETAAAHCEPDKLPRLEHWLGRIYHRIGSWELAESYYQSALESLAEEGKSLETQARILADWSLTAHRSGRTPDALSLAQKAQELAEQAADPKAQMQAHNILGILTRHQGDSPAAHAHLERAMLLSKELEDISASAAAQNNLSLVCSDDGEYKRAIDLSREALALCSQIGDRHSEAAIHSNLADLLHKVGDIDNSQYHIRQSVALLAEIGEGAEGQLPEIWKLVEW